MTDETRKALEAYCPEIKEIEYSFRFSNLRKDWLPDLIAAAVRKAIIEKGDAEWEDFLYFALDSDKFPVESFGAKFMAWLTDPTTFLTVAGEWAKKEGK